MKLGRRPRRPPRVVSEAAQSLSFSRRAIVLGLGQGALGAALIGRMAWLGIAENEHYRVLAESNRVQLQLIPPRRGWIVDRAGRPIAINRTDFRVDLIPDQLRDPERVVAELAKMLALPPEEIQRVHEELARAAGYQPVPVAENLPYERYAAISVRLPELPGVAPTQGYSRFYPDGAAVAHLVGYVGAASVEDYKADHDPLLITPGFKVGKQALEKTMERTLRGLPGAKRTEVTARGKLIRELTTRSDTPGHPIKLTIDAPLQAYVARRLGTNSGSAVMLDAATGEILAFVSMPAYDPNSFSDGISHSEWNMLSENDHLPLMNKVLQGLYPPGSTVKPMNALALLAAGFDPTERVVCTGTYRLGTSQFHCHKRHGHGALNMKSAIEQSCDIYFYTMVRRLGIERLAATMRTMGLGTKYTLPFTSQRYGTVPDNAWKLRHYKENWTIADSVNAAIGQGYVLANPLQLAVMASRIASGRALEPTLLAGSARRDAPALPATDEHLAHIREAMWGVVNGGGTGAAARMQVPGVALAGKTGTAQVRRITTSERASGVLKNAALPFKLRDHALFVGFAPADKPRYAMGIVLEHNGHTNRDLDTPAIARDIMTFQFDRPRAEATLAALEPGWGGDIGARMRTEAAEWRAAHAPLPPGPPPPPSGTAPPPPQPAPNDAAASPPQEAESGVGNGTD